jgi:hypothetical protein
MLARSRLLLAALGALLLLSASVSTASARNLSLNETGFSVRWSAYKIVTATGTTECPVTMQGTFHRRTFTKTAGLLIGSLTHVTINDAACTNGRARVRTETLPWHYRYRRFSGTLPSVTEYGFDFLLWRIRITISGAECEFTTSAEEPAVGSLNVGASGEARTLTLDPDAEIDLEDEDFLCAIAGDATLQGTGAVDGDAVEPVTTRLI